MSIFGPVDDIWYLAHMRKAKLKIVGILVVMTRGGWGKFASLYAGGKVWDGLVVVWVILVDTTDIQPFFSSSACTDMVRQSGK